MPKKISVAINGFGRIGRATFKIALENKNLEIVALNDLTDNNTLAHLLKYDSVYGIYEKPVKADAKNIYIGTKKIPVFAIPEPTKLPWKKLKVDVVIESTGRFVKDDTASAHLRAGAKRVILSAPAKGKSNIPTCLLGISQNDFSKNKIISNASCTTNSIAPVTAVIDQHFQIQQAFLTTIHSYTADQRLVDSPHKDLRRARAAAANIVPTSTGATIAVTEVLPQLQNKFAGLAVRVPTICGSLSDLTFLVAKKVTVAQVNRALKQATTKPALKNIMAYSEEPLVSSDIIKSPYSAVVDGLSTQVNGQLVKVLAWYDNEWGYSHRLVEMISLLIH